MKHNYSNIQRNLTVLVLFICCILSAEAQDVHFTFSNAQITNDGLDDYYDVDVMIESSVDFKLGSGQLYLTYNTAAFGANVSTSNNLTYSQPAGSVLAEVYGFPAYKDFIQNDNTTSRVSLAFQQGVSSGAITANNVTATPKVLFHVRIKFEDVNEDPMIAFETGAVYLDQFYTACGSSTSAGLADCSGEPGVQLLNDTFDSSNAADTTAPVITLAGANPQEIVLGSGYSELGAITDDESQITIDDSEFIDAVGTYTIYYDATDIVGNAATQVTRTVNVVPVLSIGENEWENVSIYPNPSERKFLISGLTDKVDLEIFNIEWKRIQYIQGYQSEQLDISSIESGVYFVKLISGTAIKTIRMIKI
ncbi:T9SS type A sorting domain-containing protein [Aquimarina sp. MMG016]|uniref:T9SS type A sorting domain-containing protein n=1 Tax=Aquimarina sp. MMG016 TaxID=2822690 RepID=UPI001B39F773|nr:T9SS type A sorting domain-containing protein [Aquimarina sp. MMG016]MBQ4820676.1 T9SS type A sorting domain-containing protein [Aquimarina sp. MMG016]